MKDRLTNAMMAIAAIGIGDHRRDWAAAMQAEYRIAAADGHALSFASGCLAAACRELATSAHGRFTLTSYMFVLILMVPMAALQIGCAIVGLPYLYPDRSGLSGALLEGSQHIDLLRSLYLWAVPSLALIQLAIGTGHLRLGWLLLERDWEGALRWSMWTLAAAFALIIFMTVLFLDSRQALAQAAILGIELAILLTASRWHAELGPAAESEYAG